MADTKVSALTALATPTDDDLLYVVNDPAGTPDGRKTTFNQLRTALFTANKDECSGDVAITADNTPVDVTGCTRSLAAGTWLVIGHFQFRKTATTVAEWEGMLTDGAGTTVYASAGFVGFSNNPHGASVTVSQLVTLGSTTTVKMRAQILSGSHATLANVIADFNGHDATRLITIRVA